MMRKHCAEYAERLVDLSDGELRADERAAVAAHVASCDSCRDELRRLDTSLAALRIGIVAVAPIELQSKRRTARQAMLIAIGGTAAAILLTLGTSALLKAPTSGRGGKSETAIVEKVAPHNASAPQTATTGRGFAEDDALRRIAMLEQEARLETSLALMPDDPWFDQQRASNESLLATYRKAAAAGTTNHSPQPTPRSKDTL